MAEVRPLNAVHYDLEAVGGLAAVTAPPYDVIGPEVRRRLVERSPYNVVRIDLPEAPDGGDPYRHAAETMETWSAEGVLPADPEPAIWALTQDFETPHGERLTRSGFLCRVRLEPYGGSIRPHERTQPGPKEDRLRLTRATRHNLSPIFSLHTGDAWPLIEPALGGAPWGEVADDEGTTHRVWKVADPAITGAVTELLSSSELLIADGHHRFETALAYERELGGEGPHNYVLMCLVSLEDPGLTVFATHRLLTGLAGDPAARERLGAGLKELFEVEELPLERLEPVGEQGVGVFGYADSHQRRGFRLRLRDEAALAEEMGERSSAYRELDAAILEALVLKRIMGMSDEDIAAKRGIAYTPSTEEAIASLDGDADAVFLLRPTPVEQVRAVAAEGETMPPKSTYFFPKLLTGIVFNPLT